MLHRFRRAFVRATSFKGSIGRAAAMLTLSLAAGAAHASFVGGTTTVTLDSGFVGTITSPQVGLSVAPLGTATLNGLVARFPITGNTPDTQLFHDGSGLKLSKGGTFLDLENFVVDLAALALSGRVTGNAGLVGASVPLFDIDANTLDLRLTDGAADAIAGTFGLTTGSGNTLRGALVGRAAVQAPEPGTLALLALGLAGVGAGIRRRSRGARVVAA